MEITELFQTVADLGRRPRRATACPGVFPAQLSQRSACFAPRRASVQVRRSVAPFPSPTSVPQLSHTNTVLRAILSVLSVLVAGRELPSEFIVSYYAESNDCSARRGGISRTGYDPAVDSRTIVILEGDQTGQELLEEAVRVLDRDVIGVEFDLPRFDLSLENRRATENAVVHEAARTIREHGLGLKAATVTPEGRDDVGSPNRILREEIGGRVIVRTGRRIPGVVPLGGVHAPISVVRMAVGDAYGAKEWREGEGDEEVAFRTERIERRICHAVAEFAFRQAERTGAKVFGGPKYTVCLLYTSDAADEL